MDQKEILFINDIKDTFPYIESTIQVLDDNLAWWKVNAPKLEEKITQTIQDELNINSTEIDTDFFIYNGPDEEVQSVKFKAPALRISFPDLTDEEVFKIKEKLGNEWEGKRVYQEVNNLIVLF